MTRTVWLLLVPLVLSGCFNLGNLGVQRKTPTITHYVLNDTAPIITPAPPRADAPTLLVLDTSTAGFYDTDKLVFSRSPGTRGHYQLARWTERPGKRFANLMRARLDRQSTWRVSAAGGYVRGDVLLDTEIVEFYHDAASTPGQLRLELRAELVDLKKRTILGRRIFEQTVSLASYDAAGASKAADVAVTRTLDELSAWLASFPDSRHSDNTLQ